MYLQYRLKYKIFYNFSMLFKILKVFISTIYLYNIFKSFCDIATDLKFYNSIFCLFVIPLQYRILYKL